jgi:hypothetical protein
MPIRSLLLVAALATAACAPRREPPPRATPTPVVSVRTAEGFPIIEIKAKDSSYEAPDVFPAGWASVTLNNEASEQRNAQFFRINEGVNLNELSAALTSEEYPVPRLVQFAGGLGTVPPGRSQTILQELTEGQYVMVSLIHDWYLVPRVPPGMIKLFRVVAEPAARPAPALPQRDDGELQMLDFSYSLPRITPGQHRFKLTNPGREPHEILIRQPNPGKTLADAKAYIADPAGQPPPYDDTGDGGALVFAPGKTAWMDLDLKPGNYIGICFVIEPTSGKSHAELGMIGQFTVQ